MKYAEAWDKLREITVSWRDLYKITPGQSSSDKEWLCNSFLKMMDKLEDYYE